MLLINNDKKQVTFAVGTTKPVLQYLNKGFAVPTDLYLDYRR